MVNKHNVYVQGVQLHKIKDGCELL